MMRTILKRGLAWITSLALVVGFLPVLPVSAAGADVELSCTTASATFTASQIFGSTELDSYADLGNGMLTQPVCNGFVAMIQGADSNPNTDPYIYGAYNRDGRLYSDPVAYVNNSQLKFTFPQPGVYQFYAFYSDDIHPDIDKSVEITYEKSYAVPTVTALSPTSGTTAGGTSVTITGTDFTDATAVEFGDTAAASFTIDSATKITANSPAHSAGAVDVTVTTAGGTSATGTSSQFTYTSASSLSFTSGTTADYAENQSDSAYTAQAAGTGTITYSITGGNDKDRFNIDSSSGEVTFIGAPDYETPQDLDKDNVYDITVKATDGTDEATQDVAITVTDIDDVNFSDSDNDAPGESISSNTIIRELLVEGGGTVNVSFSTVKVGENTPWTCVYPPNHDHTGSPGGLYSLAYTGATTSGVMLQVSVPSGYSFDLSSFKFAADLSSVSKIYIGTLEDTDSFGSADVTQNVSKGYTIVQPSVNDVTSVVLSSENYTLFQDFEITDLKQTSTSPAAPTVTSLSPTSGTTAGGTSVTITGTDFTDATAVEFGSTASTSFTVDSSTKITVNSPAHSAGKVDVTVTTAGGTSATGTSSQFTYTEPALAPTVTTGEVSSVAQTTATANGNVTNLGSSNPTQHGFVWSTSANPTTSNSKTEQGAVSATGAFTGSITGLAANTTYHIRAYATNSAGTSYGEDVTFATQAALVAPTVTTGEATSVAQTTATGNGNVTNLGSSNPTQHGFVWSTSANPTTSNSKTEQGTVSATGAFTGSITGLAANTTYHIRTYATNSAGTSYGEDVTFVTQAALVASTVTTGEATSVAQTTATGNGNVTNLGSSNPTQHGFVWSTSANPTTSNSKTEQGAVSATGAFTGSITGLAANTTYHIRAYATNSAGTSYGEDMTFATQAALVAPTVTSLSPTSGMIAGGTSVTITGTDFTDATAVEFGGTAATSFTVDSSTKITATSPAHSAGAVDVTVTTPAGTSATGTSCQFTYTAPLPTVTDANISISGATGTGGIYKIGDTVTVAWNNSTSGDNSTGVTGVTMNFTAFGGGAAVTATESGGVWRAAYTITVGSINGTNKNISVTAVNPAGSTTTVDTTNAAVNNILPAAPFSLALAAESDTGVADNITSNTTPTITGQAQANSTVKVFVEGLLIGTATADGSGNWSFTVPALSDGTHSFTAQTADEAGNLSSLSTACSVIIDTLGPTVSGVTDSENYNTGKAATFTEATATLAKNGGTPGEYTSGTTISESGSYTLVVTDTAGNHTVVAFTITMKKILSTITAPVAITGVANGTAKTAAALGLPAKVTLNTDSGEVQADVTWDVAASTYQSSSSAEQSFTVSGTVTLPSDVINSGSIPLTTSISVTVKRASSSSGSSSDHSSSGGGSSTSSASKPTESVTGGTTNTAIVDKNGTASVGVTDQNIADAIADARAQAAQRGADAGEITVAINVSTGSANPSTLSVNLPRTTQQQVINNGIAGIELIVNRSDFTLGMNLAAISEINRQANADVQITATRSRDPQLRPAARNAIGSRPVYDFHATYQNGTQSVTNFGDGRIFVSIPYTPASNEAVGYLYMAYVDGSGNVTRVPGSAYDRNSGCLIFETNHLSVYGIGYSAPSAKFTDISSHWAKESIDFAVGRGLFGGRASGKFGPDTAITRGDFITALGRLARANVSSYTKSSFTDVPANSYHLPYIEWACKNGIIQGVGSNRFAPERAITREEVAAVLQNYAKVTGYILPVTREAVTFADGTSIGSTDQNAVRTMQQAGVVMGGNNNKYSPKAAATRAEICAMLYRYVKLTIDPATAQGWAKNDSGQYMYYKDGKALIGWQTVNGKVYCFDSSGGAYANGWRKNSKGESFYLSSNGSAVTGWQTIARKRYYFDAYANMVAGQWLQVDSRWYYFYADGSLAQNTTIGGYQVDANGVRKA
ncbi:IPT/TIG domain-containing protein [Faecalispora anaeroviscerum]|uniref:IPT/TIG domain-containing protein n=1 Tax=Faecalispora anaeroviscerum TaxID=2991836 RepID=UPI0024BAEE1C|nr:IPT/TIG domain-containing protein [Faecalispora anaeroviscerum]